MVKEQKITKRQKSNTEDVSLKKNFDRFEVTKIINFS